MPNGRCRMHGGTSPGAPRGNTNAWKHGRYPAAAIAARRDITGLVRGMKELIGLAKGRREELTCITVSLYIDSTVVVRRSR